MGIKIINSPHKKYVKKKLFSIFFYSITLKNIIQTKIIKIPLFQRFSIYGMIILQVFFIINIFYKKSVHENHEYIISRNHI